MGYVMWCVVVLCDLRRVVREGAKSVARVVARGVGEKKCGFV